MPKDKCDNCGREVLAFDMEGSFIKDMGYPHPDKNMPDKHIDRYYDCICGARGHKTLILDKIISSHYQLTVLN